MSNNKICVFHKYRFKLAKDSKNVIFRKFFQEPEVQLANIRVNDDFFQQFLRPTIKMGQIGLFDPIYENADFLKILLKNLSKKLVPTVFHFQK